MNTRAKGILWFLIITFGVAWSNWELAIWSGFSVLSWQFTLCAFPGAFAPAIAAVIVRKWITREGFADAGLGLRVAKWRYYVIAWLLPLAVVSAIAAQAIALGLAQPDFTLARAAASGAAGHDVAGLSGMGLAVVPQLMLAAVIATPVLWGEEFGWRGYLQRRMVPGRPELNALCTGVIWGVWHWPLTLRGYDFPDHPVLGSFLLVVLAILMSYIFDWLREKSRSIWAPSLAHASTNTIGGISVLWFGGALGPSIASYGGLLSILPILLVCVAIFLFERREPETATETVELVREA
jgi:uncharacterized protein